MIFNKLYESPCEFIYNFLANKSSLNETYNNKHTNTEAIYSAHTLGLIKCNYQ